MGSAVMLPFQRVCSTSQCVLWGEEDSDHMVLKCFMHKYLEIGCTEKPSLLEFSLLSESLYSK